jgi:hypothetical protein
VSVARSWPSTALASRPQGRGVLEAIAPALVIVTVAVGAYHGLLTRVSFMPPPPSHAAISLDQAFNLAVCGSPGVLSSEFDLALELSRHPDALDQPLRHTAVRLAGSAEGYCAAAVSPYQNNENALMWMMRVIIGADRNLSAARLAHDLIVIRLVMIGMFVFALVLAGVGLAWCLTLALFAVGILNHLEPYDLTVYPFLLTLPLLNVAFYVVCRRFDLTAKGRRYTVAVCGVAGALAAFTANMRSTHLVLCVAMFVLFLLSATRPGGAEAARRQAARTFAISSAAFVVAFVTFELTVMSPLKVPESRESVNYSYHAIMHPIVLGLANPESDLSRREGIEWDDRIGLTLARRINPEVTFLGPRYEPALARYYVRLWRRYPLEMVRLYWAKITLAGNGVFDTASRVLARYGVPTLRVASLDGFVNGWMLFAITAVEFCWAWWRSIRSPRGLFLGISLLSACSCLLFAECALITTTFYPAYDSLFLFNLFVAVSAPAQAAVDALAGTRLA